ncbi:MAG: DUF934 domain-containing protein [Caulobacteraceae bacterium]|nr:DUF934 domain-containing protein [Caulobacteraceae bacterium]
MPNLIRWCGDQAVAVEDVFTTVDDDQTLPPGEVIVSLGRFRAEGDYLLGQDRRLGVRLQPDEAPETLANELPALCVVALAFPKFRDGRPFSAARVLRERLGYQGQVRAVGDVLLEQAKFMIRCGFDAFEPADGTTPDQWTHAAHRFRHVYQRAADERRPAFVERGMA